MGPLGAWLADSLAESLVEGAGGRFQVVDNRRMSKALARLKLDIDDLGENESLRKIASEVGGLDGVIVGRVVDLRDPPRAGQLRGKLRESEVTCNLVDLRTGDLVGSGREKVAMTPTLKAYRGEPNDPSRLREVLGRAGVDTKATNIPDGIDGEVLGGSGSPPPGGNLAPVQIRPSGNTGNGVRTTSGSSQGVHPFEIPKFPFALKIVVNGKHRPYEQVYDEKAGRNRYFVAIEPGETYQIYMENNAPRDFFTAVYVDGVNILGMKRDLDDPQVWFLGAGKKFQFPGWTTRQQGKDVVREFEVAHADEAVASSVSEGRSFGEATMGSIVALFYLLAKDGDLNGHLAMKATATGTFGTKAGATTETKLEDVQGQKRGYEVEEAHIVINYAPQSHINKLKNSPR